MDAADLTSSFFLPPYDTTSLDEKTDESNEWLERHQHRLRWDGGYTPYTDMPHTIVQICSNFSMIYTKGLEKMDFLRTYHHSVVDLNEENTLMASNSSGKRHTSVRCPSREYHRGLLNHCALHNAMYYSDCLVTTMKDLL